MKRQNASSLRDQPVAKKNAIASTDPAVQTTDPERKGYTAPPTPPYNIADLLIDMSMDTNTDTLTDQFTSLINGLFMPQEELYEPLQFADKTITSKSLDPLLRDTTVTDTFAQPATPSTKKKVDIVATKSHSGRACDGCSHARFMPATMHCLNCLAFYCLKCLMKHNSSPLFHNHKLTSLKTDIPQCKMYCQHHPSHLVTHICESCERKCLVCPICMLDHDQSHTMFDLRGSARKLLSDGLNLVKGKRNETYVIYKEMYSAYAKSKEMLPQALQSVKDWANEQIEEIRKQEQQLLMEAEDRLRKMKIKLCSRDARMTEMVTLCSEIKTVLKGSDKECFSVYDKLSLRIGKVKHWEVEEASIDSNDGEHLVKKTASISNVTDTDTRHTPQGTTSRRTNAETIGGTPSTASLTLTAKDMSHTQSAIIPTLDAIDTSHSQNTTPSAKSNISQTVNIQDYVQLTPTV